MGERDIRMTRTEQGSPDGFSIELYLRGETYSVPVALAVTFVEEMKVATYLEDDKATKKRGRRGV